MVLKGCRHGCYLWTHPAFPEQSFFSFISSFQLLFYLLRTIVPSLTLINSTLAMGSLLLAEGCKHLASFAFSWFLFFLHSKRVHFVPPFQKKMPLKTCTYTPIFLMQLAQLTALKTIVKWIYVWANLSFIQEVKTPLMLIDLYHGKISLNLFVSRGTVCFPFKITIQNICALCPATQLIHPLGLFLMWQNVLFKDFSNKKCFHF